MDANEAVRLYAGWVASYKKYGAEISALPNDPRPLYIEGKPFPRVVAVFRDPQVWGKLVNTKLLPMPDVYGGNGRIGYYVAPTTVQDAYRKVIDMQSQASADAATQSLLEKWGVPTPLRGLDQLFGTVKWAVLAIVALQLVKAVRR